MTDIAPGWYRDPADTTTKRYWDGEGWIGEPIAADATPPPGPPVVPAPGATPPAVTPPAGPHPAQPPVRPTPAGPPRGGDRPAGAMPTPPAWMTAYPGAPVRPHGLALASAGSRLGARVVDILVVFLLCVVANAWFGYQMWLAMEPRLTEAWRRYLVNDTTDAPLPEPSQDITTLLLMILLVIMAVWFAYEVPGTANSGQTLGKRLMGIKVMRMESEERLGFGRSMRRWTRLGVPTLLWLFCFLGAILQALDCLSVVTDRPLRQALHDKSAATIVVQVARSPRPNRKHDTPSSPDALVGGRDADPRKP